MRAPSFARLTGAGTSTRSKVFRLAAAILVVVAVVLLVLWARLGLFLRDSAEIQRRSDVRMTKLNADFASFRGDPESAAKALPSFVAGGESLRKQSAALAGQRPPAVAAEYSSALRSTLETSAVLCDDLAALARRVVARGRLLDGLGKQVAAFEKNLKAAGSDAEGLKAVRELREGVEAARKDLEGMPAIDLAVYSDTTLEERLEALSSALGEMERGLGRRDVNELSQSLIALRDALQTDWAPALLEIDRAGSRSYANRIVKVEQLAAKASAERAELERRASRLLVFGALSMLGAMTAGLYSMQR